MVLKLVDRSTGLPRGLLEDVLKVGEVISQWTSLYLRPRGCPMLED